MDHISLYHGKPIFVINVIMYLFVSDITVLKAIGVVEEKRSRETISWIYKWFLYSYYNLNLPISTAWLYNITVTNRYTHNTMWHLQAWSWPLSQRVGTCRVLSLEQRVAQVCTLEFSGDDSDITCCGCIKESLCINENSGWNEPQLLEATWGSGVNVRQHYQKLPWFKGVDKRCSPMD